MKTVKTIINNHLFWVLIFASLPFSLILLRSYFRLGEGQSLVIFTLALLAIHFLMPIGRDILHHNERDKK